MRFAPIAIAVFMLLGIDNPQGLPWRANSAPSPDVLAGMKIPVLPSFAPARQSQPAPDAKPTPTSSDSSSSAQSTGQSQGQVQNVSDTPHKSGPSSGTMDQPAELALIRFVDGEYAHAVRSLPNGKDGFIMHMQKPFDDNMLHRVVQSHGAAVNPGDNVQITAMKFKKTEIIVLINGGGNRHGSWLDHMQIGISGLPTSSSSANNNGPDTSGAAGTTLILDFGGPIPEMTPDELKEKLAPVLNFGQQRSAAVIWSETLPPAMEKAIEEKRAIVGMTREMVEAAVGKPDKKIREKNANGDETEDWIYGTPPAVTMFVTFIGEKVTNVKEFPKNKTTAVANP
jgi:hypothetical protein